jgi:hypothetical protein
MAFLLTRLVVKEEDAISLVCMVDAGARLHRTTETAGG